MKLTKEELNVLIQVLNMPRTQNLQSAGFCIGLSNKLSQELADRNLIDAQKEPMGKERQPKVANPKK